MTAILIITLIVVSVLLVLALCFLAGLLESFDNGVFCETNCPYKGDCKPLGANRFNFHEKK